MAEALPAIGPTTPLVAIESVMTSALFGTLRWFVIVRRQQDVLCHWEVTPYPVGHGHSTPKVGESLLLVRKDKRVDEDGDAQVWPGAFDDR